MSAKRQEEEDEEQIYTFIVEWYDSVADLNKKYRLTYWLKDNSLSMYDITKNKLFLKRITNKDITFPNDLYIGKTIIIYSRQLKIIDYADTFTKNKFNSISKLYNISFVGFKSFTYFLNKIPFNDKSKPFHFKTIKSVKITGNDKIQQSLGSQNDENEVLIFCQFIGCQNIENTFNECKNDENNNFNGKIFDEINDKELIFEMTTKCESSAEFMFDKEKDENCTLCLIKPESLSFTGSILNDILNEGFLISAITTRKLEIKEAKKFYEIYDGVVKEYNYLIEQLLSGSIIALQIKCISGDNRTFNEFREFVGPKDPEIAKYIRPNTLRAKYGINRIKNGIHCTDLQEDGVLESKFFFS